MAAFDNSVELDVIMRELGGAPIAERAYQKELAALGAYFAWFGVERVAVVDGSVQVVLDQSIDPSGPNWARLFCYVSIVEITGVPPVIVRSTEGASGSCGTVLRTAPAALTPR